MAGILAYLLYRFIEKPVMQQRWLRARPRRSLWLALGTSVAVAAVGLGGWQVTRSMPIDAGIAYTSQGTPNAPDLIDYVPSNLTPSLREAEDTSDRCLYPVGRPVDSSEEPCLFSENDQAPLVVIWGDSHAGHLTEALMPLVRSAEIQLTVFGKGSCPSSGAASEQRYAFAYCAEYQEWALNEIRESAPRAVLFSNYSSLYAEWTDPVL